MSMEIGIYSARPSSVASESESDGITAGSRVGVSFLLVNIQGLSGVQVAAIPATAGVVGGDLCFLLNFHSIVLFRFSLGVEPSDGGVAAALSPAAAVASTVKVDGVGSWPSHSILPWLLPQSPALGIAVDFIKSLAVAVVVFSCLTFLGQDEGHCLLLVRGYVLHWLGSRVKIVTDEREEMP